MILNGKKPTLPPLSPVYEPFVKLFYSCISPHPNDRPQIEDILEIIDRMVFVSPEAIAQASVQPLISPPVGSVEISHLPTLEVSAAPPDSGSDEEQLSPSGSVDDGLRLSHANETPKFHIHASSNLFSHSSTSTVGCSTIESDDSILSELEALLEGFGFR